MSTANHGLQEKEGRCKYPKDEENFVFLYLFKFYHRKANTQGLNCLLCAMEDTSKNSGDNLILNLRSLKPLCFGISLGRG